MSAPDPAGIPSPPLLVVIDPAARHVDGESVRIARDVLCAGAPGVKVCLPEGPEDIARALARRGSRRPVVVGDDVALLRTVQLLHRESALSEAVLSVVPVGTSASVALALGLGVPPDAVSAARTVLDGAEQPLDLLVDDSGGVVLGGLSIPATAPPGPAGPVSGGTGQAGGGTPVAGTAGGAGVVGAGSDPAGGVVGDAVLEARASLLRAYRSLARTVREHVPQQAAGRARVTPQRLRVEADGELLADIDRPIEEVSVVTDRADGLGLAQIAVRPKSTSLSSSSAAVRARARTITVTGADFRYRADALLGGPVQSRTWTVLPHAWRLTLPR